MTVQRILTLLIALSVGSAAASAICGQIEWFLYSIVAACIAIIALGLAKAVGEPPETPSQAEIDEHWESLPPWMKPATGEWPVSTEVHTAPAAFTVIKGGREPAWQADDHRPVWDHANGAPE